jgi:hypothetical protein
LLTDENRSVQVWAAQERALHVAKIATGALDEAGVRSLPVKGVLLARQVYDPARRPIGDVDLVIEPSNLKRALRAARASGWNVVWDSKTLGNVNVVVRDVPVDIVCSLGPAGVSAVGATDMLSRATRCDEPLGFPHWQIDVHDHALLLAVDAFKDKLGRGKPWAREDLVRICALDGFSLPAFVERASAARLRTMLAIVAEWVVASAPDAAWSEIGARLREAPLRRGFAERYERALRTSGSRWQRWRLSAMTRAVSDSPARRALALALGALGTARFVARHGSLDAKVWNRSGGGGRD